MSTRFSINLNKKDDDKLILSILELCSQDSKELDDEIGLAYDTNTLLTNNIIDKILSYYDYAIRRSKDRIDEFEKERARYFNILPLARDKNNYEFTQAYIFELSSSINFYNEEIDRYKALSANLSLISSFYFENDEFYLSYYYG